VAITCSDRHYLKGASNGNILNWGKEKEEKYGVSALSMRGGASNAVKCHLFSLTGDTLIIGRRIDYLSIDAEENEYDILSQFNFSRYTIGIIVSVEQNGEFEPTIEVFLNGQG
jgi:hypothetical protein